MASSTEEIRYKLLKFLAQNPEASQRDVARHLGISLGRVNYCLRGMIQLGWVKAQNFKNSNRKAAYLYLLTPTGVEQKVSLAIRFLQRRLSEYDRLAAEIALLQAEVDSETSVHQSIETISPAPAVQVPYGS